MLFERARTGSKRRREKERENRIIIKSFCLINYDRFPFIVNRSFHIFFVILSVGCGVIVANVILFLFSFLFTFTKYIYLCINMCASTTLFFYGSNLDFFSSHNFCCLNFEFDSQSGTYEDNRYIALRSHRGHIIYLLGTLFVVHCPLCMKYENA